MTSNEKLNLIIEMQDKFSGTLDTYDKKIDEITKSSKKAEDATDKLQTGFGKAKSKMSAMIGPMAAGAAAIGATAVATFTLVKARMTDIDEMAKQSIAYGETIETMSAYNYVAQKNKTSTETMGEVFKKITEDLGAAAIAGNYAETNFGKLGIATTGLNGELLSSNEIFLNSVDALGKITNPTERAAKATQIFGDKAGELAPIIEGGTAAIKDQIAQAGKMGAIITEADALRAAEFNDTLLDLTTQITGVATQLAVALAPALGDIMDDVSDAIVIWQDWKKSFDDVWDSIHTIGGNKKFGLALDDEQMKTVPAYLIALGKTSKKLIELEKNWDSLGGGTKENTEKWNKLIGVKNRVLATLKEEGISTQQAINGATRYNQSIDKQTELLNKRNAARKTNSDVSKTVGTNAAEDAAKERAVLIANDKALLLTGQAAELNNLDEWFNNQLSKYEKHHIDTANLRELYARKEDEIVDVHLKKKQEKAKIFNDEKATLTNEMYLLTLSDSSLELANLQSDYDTKLALLEEFNVDSTELNKKFSEDKQAILDKEAEDEKARAQAVTMAKIQAAREYGNMAISIGDLMVAADKKNANLAKGVAVGTVVMNGAIGMSKAISKGYAGIPEGIMVAASTAASLIKINEQSFATGGVVQGSNYTGDNIPINVNAGEMVLTKNQQQELLSLADGSSSNSNSGTVYNINISGNVGTNERKIAQLVRNGTDKLAQTNQPNRQM